MGNLGRGSKSRDRGARRRNAIDRLVNELALDALQGGRPDCSVRHGVVLLRGAADQGVRWPLDAPDDWEAEDAED
eukprot:11538007-Heterocapsa_arctica.AAC.1